MQHLRVSWLVVWFVFATAAEAADVDLSMTSTVGYDDNVFRTDSHADDDVTFRFGPTVRVRDTTSKMSYNLSYNPVYEKFIDFEDADDLSHFVHGAFETQLGDRTVFNIQDNFRKVQSINMGPLVANEDAVGNDINLVPDTDIQRSDIYRNTASAALTHNFTAHTQGELTLSHDFFDSDRDNTSTNNMVSGFANLAHTLSASDQVGLGFGTSWQRFDGVTGQPQTDTFIFQLMGSWTHNFGQDTELSMRAGPAVIYTDQKADKPRTAQQWPHRLVNVAGGGMKTIGQAYAALGLITPTDIQDLDGNPLAASDMISDQSVLIPEDTSCLSSMVNGQLVFDQSNCSFNVVVDSGGGYGAVANTIATTPNVPLGYVSSSGHNDDTRVTAFGEVGITHFWIPEFSSSASYSRSDSGATSLGSSTIADRVMTEHVWTPTRRWDLRVRGDWLRRKSATDTSNTFVVIAADMPPVGGAPSPIVSNTALVTDTFDDSVDTEYWRVAGRIAYRTSRRSTVSLRAAYQHQDTDRGATRANSSFDNFLVFLGFRYDLDPFHF